MTEKKKRAVKNQVPCPDCGRAFMNSGALRIHKAHCKGKGSGEASGGSVGSKSAASNGGSPTHPPQPRGAGWDPLGM